MRPLLLVLLVSCSRSECSTDPCMPGGCCVVSTAAVACACRTAPRGYLPTMGAHVVPISALDCRREADFWKSNCEVKP